MLPKMWDKPLWERVWPCLDPWDSAFAHSIHALECPIENEEEEDEDDWRKENQMGVHWDEDAKLEEILE